MKDNSNFLTAFDALIKNADHHLQIEFFSSRDPLSREQQEGPSVARLGSTVYWRVKETHTLDDHAANLVKVEELMDEALAIDAHDKKTMMEHPDLFVAMKGRAFKTGPRY